MAGHSSRPADDLLPGAGDSGTLRAGASMPAPYPTAAEAFLQILRSEVNREDVHKMVGAQEHMLMRFEKTNEMLLNFNALSTARYETTCRDFKHHTQLLVDMKKDLDSIFKRIRVIKTKLGQQHPQAFKVCSDVYNMLEVEEMEEDGVPVIQTDAAMLHSTTAPQIHPGAAVTHLGAEETPAAQCYAKPPQDTGESTGEKDPETKMTLRTNSGARKKERRPEVRKSWPAAKQQHASACRSKPGVAVVIAGEEDDSDA